MEVITVADICIRRWADGKDAALDLTVTSSPASSNLAAATARLGGALDKAYNRKMHDTADACREQGLVFFPIAFKALGGVHRIAVTQLKRLGAALGRHSGSDERELVSQILQKFLFISCEAMLLSSVAAAWTPTSCHLNLTV